MSFCASVMYSSWDIVSVDKLSSLACEKYVLIEFTFSPETKHLHMHMQLTFASFLKNKKIIKMIFFLLCAASSTDQHYYNEKQQFADSK